MATLQFKRGTKSVLDVYGVTPAIGEPIWEKDTNRLKIGDGEHLYVDLPYFGPEELEVDDASIELNSNSLISIFGFENASDGQAPIKSGNQIVWEVVATENDIQTLQTTINGITTIINSITPNVSLIPTLVDESIEHEDRITALERTVQAISPTVIQEALEKVEQFDDRLDADEALLGQHETRLDDLEENTININEDICIIYGGSADEVIINDHEAEEHNNG